MQLFYFLRRRLHLHSRYRVHRCVALRLHVHLHLRLQASLIVLQDVVRPNNTLFRICILIVCDQSNGLYSDSLAK